MIEIVGDYFCLHWWFDQSTKGCSSNYFILWSVVFIHCFAYSRNRQKSELLVQDTWLWLESWISMTSHDKMKKSWIVISVWCRNTFSFSADKCTLLDWLEMCRFAVSLILFILPVFKQLAQLMADLHKMPGGAGLLKKQAGKQKTKEKSSVSRW